MNVPYESVDSTQRKAMNLETDEARDFDREAGEIREDLENTLNALHRKLSPRELLDRSLEYVQENGGDILQKVSTSVSKNPLPLLVTSAGLIWLFASSRSQAAMSHRSRAPSTSRRPGDFDRASQSFGDPGNGKAQGLKQRAHQTLDAVSSKASETLEVARQRTQEYKDDLGSFVSEQPLACGAIAIAVGAILGAAFPVSEYERDMVVKARNAAADLAAEASEEPSAGRAVSH